VQRENTHQACPEAHGYLANYYELHRDFQAVRRHAMRMLELDPWREEAHRPNDAGTCLDGERTAALAQYETVNEYWLEET